MADVKIADLLTATTVADTDLFIVEDNADTKKITKTNLVSTLGINGKAPTVHTHSMSQIIDYEQGTWVPNIIFGTSNTGLTVTTAEGNYVKIGKVVTCTCTISLSNKGTSVGNARITGLPFHVSGTITCPVARFVNLTMPSGTTTVSIVLNGTNGDIAASGSNLGFVGVTDVSFSNTTGFRFAIQYITV